MVSGRSPCPKVTCCITAFNILKGQNCKDREYKGAAATAAAAAAKLLQLCPTLCDPIDGSPPGSAIPGILQARTLEWVAIMITGKVKVFVTQSFSTLCNPMHCSPPGSSVHVILQARILEWEAAPFPRGSSQPRDCTQSPALQADCLSFGP